MNNKIWAVFLFLILSGCSSVTSKYPVGLENFAVIGNDWNGTWGSDEMAITILVKDEAKGIVQLAWIERNLDKLKFQSVTCRIMKGRKWLYANVLEASGENVGDFYFWAKVKKDDNKIVIWRPSVAAFRDAVAAKRLQAASAAPDRTKEDAISDDSVQIIDPPEVLVDLVESSGSTYFEWEEPTTLVKISD